MPSEDQKTHVELPKQGGSISFSLWLLPYCRVIGAAPRGPKLRPLRLLSRFCFTLPSRERKGGEKEWAQPGKSAMPPPLCADQNSGELSAADSRGHHVPTKPIAHH
ncbi:hypothetical protein NDU88_009837 [Pleurodeles waltl]|uniref:Uncharacterized protein n=1 Tax=Pleurodeles waltl TaxID=8319 RepID=A0AAV7QUN5_PLEWA|nr:hypothetical protein NDU88_009837 [Pleurodeles waltl]